MVLTAKDYALTLIFLIADQVTKYAAVVIKPNNILFQYTQNTGAAWGMLQGKNTWLLLLGIIVLILLWKPLKESKGHEHLAYLALYAGIIGNSVDRLVRGAVVDFISIGNFPIFNVADSLITVSILYLVATGLSESFTSWNFKRKTKKNKNF